MTERIEGLAIGLDLDTLALDRGLTGLKDRLKSVNSEMKANLSAFDRGDKSIEKYETTLDGLNKKIEVQKRIVQESRAEYEKMVKEFGEGSKEAEKAARAYNNQVASLNSLQRFVDRTADELKNLREEQQETNTSFSKLNQTIEGTVTRLNQFGDSALNAGTTLTAGVSTPLAGLGIVSIKSASDIQKSQGKIQASLGITKQEAKELNETAINVWKNGFGESMTDVSEGLTQVRKNLQNISGKELEKVTRQAFILRDTFGYEIPESTRAAKALIDNFGVDGARAMDYIAVAAQKGGDYSAELLDTISEYSIQFKTAGIDIDGMFNILIQGAQNGSWSMDKTADAIKEFSIRAVDGSKTTADGFKMVGLNADDMSKKFAEGGDSAQNAFMATVAAIASMEDPLKQQQAGVALFGTQWEDVQKNVIGAMNPTKDVLGEVAGATEEAGKALQDNFGDRALKELRELGATLQPLGNILLDTIEPAFESASEHIKEFTEWMENLSPEGQKTVVAIAAITAALGPVAFGVSVVSRSLGVLTGVLGKGVSAFGKYALSAKVADEAIDDLGNTADKSTKKLKNADGKIGKTSKVLGGLKGGAGLAAGSLLSVGSGAGILSSALGFLTGPIGLTVAGLGAAVGAGTLLYKNWDQIQDSSSLLKTGLATVLPGLYGIVGGIKGIRSMSDETIPKIEDFGNKVSDSTAKAVLGYKKLNDEATIELNKLMWSGQTISQQTADTITGIFSQMGEKISSSLKTNYDKSYNFMAEHFKNSKALSESEEATILGNTQVRYQRQLETVQLQEAKIKEIMDRASQEKRTLTQEEKNQINQIQRNMMNTAVQTMSQSEIEQKVIMERLKNESANITAQQAATTVQNSLKAKNGAIREANDKYNKTVAAIIRERDETGTISAAQANKLISEAERQKNESVRKATDMHKNVVNQAKLQAGGQVDQIDWGTGQVLTQWDLLLRGSAKTINAISSGINWILDKIGVKSKIPMWEPKGYNNNTNVSKTRRATGNAEQYAKGTPSSGHPGGPAIVGEKGAELAYLPGTGVTLLGTRGPEYHPNFPRGASVLPNKHTEKLLKSYGFPGYEDGVGNFFDWVIKGPKAVLNNVWKMFDVNMPNLGGVFGDIGKGMISFLNGKVHNFIDSKIESMFNFQGSNTSGSVKSWIAQAMAITGVPSSWMSALTTIAMKESGGNPRAYNGWDINAKRGIASRGLMQTIPPTFEAYKLPGLNDIYNPVHNAVAAIRYIKARYGDVFNVPGIKSMASGGAYRGYETGGKIFKDGLYRLAEGGWPEYVIPTDPRRRTEASKLLALAGKEVQGNKRPHQLPNVSNTNSNNGLLEAILEQNMILMALLQSTKNIENKPVLTTADIGRAAEQFDSLNYTKNNIFSGRVAF
ncbi:phage tail tape measure protein [uncultured Metabacillus sp.]|uniref:phage tail tape measure protein n=1 Tax=uncultured Metabacillus sp. TaxID=2860135 RepID=UPI00262E6827|nr:phage tail tape measure protein [uncultured Metabacillus sp.]